MGSSSIAGVRRSPSPRKPQQPSADEEVLPAFQRRLVPADTGTEEPIRIPSWDVIRARVVPTSEAPVPPLRLAAHYTGF